MVKPTDVLVIGDAGPSGPRDAGERAIAPDGSTIGARATLADSARWIAKHVAAIHADSVDREARFPAETIAALQRDGLLGAAVPHEFGGRGASLRAVAAVCYELGQACASSAMVFAMHQIQVACLVRHATNSPWHRHFLGQLAREQWLVASATTENGSGDTRHSDCALLSEGGRTRVEKRGCVISYAEQADAILLTARRTPDSVASDQAALLLFSDQCRLVPVARWDTLGMRGTCSHRFGLEAVADPDQIVPAEYARISAETMLPLSHIVWAALWLGIATDACQRARRVMRRRLAPGAAAPSGSSRLADAMTRLQSLRGVLAHAIERYEGASRSPDVLGSIPFALAMNQLKLAVSAGAVEIVGAAMQVSGLAGYRNDGPDTLGRHLRDIHSSVLMIGNDRILANCAALIGGLRDEPGFLA